jgi:hypothetical protein
MLVSGMWKERENMREDREPRTHRNACLYAVLRLVLPPPLAPYTTFRVALAGKKVVDCRHWLMHILINLHAPNFFYFYSRQFPITHTTSIVL